MDSTDTQHIMQDYLGINQTMQGYAVQVGAGKAVYPPKISAQQASDIVNDFLSYNSITVGVMEEFQGNCIQFEHTGKIFTTAHAFTQAILDDCKSRGVIVDKHMLALVSSSAHAVSSDVVFLHLMLNPSGNNDHDNPLLPTSVDFVHKTKTRSGKSDISAKVGASIGLSFLHLGASGSSTKQLSHATTHNSHTTGVTRVDSVYRDTLTCISAIYSLEKAGLLPEGQFMNSLVATASISAQSSGVDAHDQMTASQILTDSASSIDSINEALSITNKMADFLVDFCGENLRKTKESSEYTQQDSDFWSVLGHAAEFGSMRAVDIMHRYVDHTEQPEVHMAFGLLRAMDILNKSGAEVTAFLRKGIDRECFGASVPDSKQLLRSIQISPVLDDDVALAVFQDMNSRDVRVETIRILDVVDMFPDMEQYTIGTATNPRLSADSMDLAISHIHAINDMLNADYSQNMGHIVDIYSGGLASGFRVNVSIHKEPIQRARARQKW